MIQMSLPTLAGLLSVSTVQPAIEFVGVSIDSRRHCNGRLFIALQGDRFDGHDYVEAAYQDGAVAALVEHRLDCQIPQIIIADCRQAMICLARHWRHHCVATVIALTGSNGKTTVKEMLSQILQKQAPTHATPGNFNNDIGVPLTLFELSSDDGYAVVELGASQHGDIARLASIVEPDIVYVNNAAAAHLAGFGNIQGVIDTKGELYAYCQARHVAVFNNDEIASQQWRQYCAAEKQLSCALVADADITADWQMTDTGLIFSINYQGQTRTTSLCVFGEHNARNALAAITIAVAAGVDFSQTVKNLAGFCGVSGRLQMIDGPQNSRLIDDSYNANPDSLGAGINVLCALSGEAWLALGDMAELGAGAQQLHDQAALTARRQGVRKMFAIGPLSKMASRRFGEDGFGFECINEMAKAILAQIHQDVNLLIKGSRSSGMEKLLNALLSHNNTGKMTHVV